MPLGAPLWLDIDEPQEPGGRLRRLVVAQDTGGAIRGPVRGDLFVGTGPVAGERAGAMQQRGGYVVLLPKTVAEKRKRVS
jgi:membrane-bound lytic murein transglycosylase A